MYWKWTTVSEEKGGSRRIVDRTARWVLVRQRKIADHLNGLVAKLAVKNVKISLLVFCLFSNGFSGYLMISGLSTKNQTSPALKIEQATVPKHFDKTGDVTAGMAANADMYWKMEAFKSYRDSLAVHNRRSYDSLLLESPGLMDTIRVLEEIYRNK